MIDVELPVVIERQPNDTTCGPTSLHVINHYWGDPIHLKSVIGSIFCGVGSDDGNLLRIRPKDRPERLARCAA